MVHVTNHVQQVEQENNLPHLVGTDNQVAWARTIRSHFVKELAAIDASSISTVARIKLASRWIEEVRLYVGNAKQWIDENAEKAKIAAMTPTEARANIWRKAEEHKDKYPTFDLVAFMGYVGGQDDEWVKRWHGKPIASMNQRRQSIARVARMAVSAS